MASLNDPFDSAEGRPAFAQRLSPAERSALAFFASVGIVADAVAVTALALHATGAVGKGLSSCLFLLGVALVASVLLMALPSKPTPLRRALVSCAALVATAALASAFSLVEMLALAFVRTAYADPLGGDAEKLTALFIASVILFGALGILTAAVRKTTALPGALAALVLCASALPALLLYQLSLPVVAVIAVVSLGISAILIARGSKT